MDDLEPCPFCGGGAQYTWNEFQGRNNMATCKRCGASAFWKKWNTRAQPDKPAAPVSDAPQPAESEGLVAEITREAELSEHQGDYIMRKHAHLFRSAATRLAQYEQEAIPISALLKWIEECWPEGSGSDFNQGVVRGFEIIKAQLENGHIQEFAVTRPCVERPPAAEPEPCQQCGKGDLFFTYPNGLVKTTCLNPDCRHVRTVLQHPPAAEGLVDDLREVRELVALWAEYEPTIGRTGRALGKLDAILATLTKGAD